MKKTLVALMALVMLCTVTTPLLAADPDFWGVDSKAEIVQHHDPIAQQTVVNTPTDHQRVQNQPVVTPKDDWTPVGDGYSDGMGYFPDLGMLIYWLYGKHMFGW